MNPNLHKVIGIDLGTTYSAVAAYHTANLSAETILNAADGDGTTTASVISIDPFTRKAVVGAWAKRNRPADPENTVIEIKREMGEEFTKQTLQKYSGERGGFREGDPVRAHFAGHWLLPQEISAFTLMRMKQVAEQEIGEEIRDAVVTVPAYFTERQKRATREAALLAGLYPRQIIPEPTAAAICYGVDRNETEKKIYLVYDLGGGTFDVSIIDVEGQKVEVIATAGDPRLGGGDFDDAIVKWALDELAEKHRIGLRDEIGERAMRRKAQMKLDAESAKIILSSAPETMLPALDLNPANPPIVRLTQEKFVELIGGLLNKSLNCVDKAISLAADKGVARDQISAILLVGGSSKIPKVKQLLLDYFKKGDEFVRADADPDQVVARGAAILANGFKPSPPPFDIKRPVDNTLVNTDAADQITVRHITEHSLGVAVQGGLFSKIVEQGANIPTEVTRGNYTNPGPINDIEARVFQGEGQYVDDCTEIGTVHIAPIEALPEGRHRFEITFALDANGLLTATIHQQNTGKRWTATFNHKTGVGGVDALAAMRNKLLGMFAGKVVQPPLSTTTSTTMVPGNGQPTAPTQPAQTYVPVPPPNFQQQVSPASMQPAAVATTPATAVPAPSGVAMPVPVQPETQSAAPTSTPPAPSSTGAAPQMPSPNLPTPTKDVPEQYQSLVRRAQKQLLKQADARLAEAYCEFVTGLNRGDMGTDLEDLGEDLKDAYDKARWKTP